MARDGRTQKDDAAGSRPWEDIFTTDSKHMLCSIVLWLFVMLWAWKLNTGWPAPELSFPREENASPEHFWSFVGMAFIICMVTLKRDPKDKSGQYINRNQTEEWKGWMQLMFLMYHYYRARYVYNEIRVFVSCYVWMTGFGNYLYFMKKEDFSLRRCVTTVIRINLLTVGLMAVNKTNIMLYYVVPLHTTFFFVTFANCWLAKRIKRPLLALGITLACLVLFFEILPSALSHEAKFRFGLDKYSSWYGMIVAHILMSVKKDFLAKDSWWFTTCMMFGGIVLIATWFLSWGNHADKYWYNARHPFIVAMPILGYIMIRNCHSSVRQVHSAGMAWFGRITLETYVLQFHIFMCNNVENILVVFPNYPTVNTFLVGGAFILVALLARKLTIQIMTWVGERIGAHARDTVKYAPVPQYLASDACDLAKSTSPSSPNGEQSKHIEIEEF